ncbi:MAG: sulfocyanin-like copper-binding protein [Solirubrobacteraceae bacterium]
MRARHAAVAMLFAGSLALSACGSASPSRAHPSPQRWLSFDAAARTATVTLTAAYNAAAGGFNLNGANKGALLFSVPSRWTVTVRCVNNASDRNYACVLARSPGAPAAVVPQTARTGSELAPGARASFSFTPRTPTRYRLLALTGGREPVGMWLTLAVTPSGSPSVRWVR